MAQPQPQDSLAAYAQVQRTADREILAALRLSFRDTTRQLSIIAREGDTPANQLQRARILAVRKAILESQAQFYERAGNVIQRRRVEAAARAIQVSGRYDEAVFARAGREDDLRAVSESLEETEARAPEALIARLSPDGTRMDLSQRVYRTRAFTEGLLERRINSALARGLSAREFAREIQDLVDPNTPGGVRFAALRLARTEINNAYHAMSIRAAELKPWVVGMEWHTSGSHSRPDECDRLRGQAFKPPADTPRKPHPQCMCYVTPIVGGDDGEAGDDAFLDDLVNGLFDDVVAAADQPGGVAGYMDRPGESADALAARRAEVRARAAAARAVEAARAVPALGDAPANRSISQATQQIPTRHRARVRRVLNRQAAIAPQAAGRLNSVEIGATQRDSSLAEYHRSQRRIVVAPRTMGYGSDYRRAMEETGWSSRCGHDHGTAEGTLAHEFGHHVHMSASWTNDDTRRLVDIMVNTMGVRRPTNYRMDSLQFQTWIGYRATRERMQDFVSSYAATNLDEFLAECWAEYSTSDSPRQAARDIGELMREVSERD